jgi:hypothetical protein
MEKVCTWPLCPCRATGEYCSNKPEPKKKKGLKKVSEKGKKQRKLDLALLNTDAVVYLDIWQERPHVCQCCKNKLTTASRFMFHHCLPKRYYDAYRHAKWNILILCSDCHTSWESNPDNQPGITEYTIKIYIQYVDPNSHPSLKDILQSDKTNSDVPTTITEIPGQVPV